jgi:hypothetical protein
MKAKQLTMIFSISATLSSCGPISGEADQANLKGMIKKGTGDDYHLLYTNTENSDKICIHKCNSNINELNRVSDKIEACSDGVSIPKSTLNSEPKLLNALKDRQKTIEIKNDNTTLSEIIAASKFISKDTSCSLSSYYSERSVEAPKTKNLKKICMASLEIPGFFSGNKTKYFQSTISSEDVKQQALDYKRLHNVAATLKVFQCVEYKRLVTITGGRVYKSVNGTRNKQAYELEDGTYSDMFGNPLTISY